MRLFRRPLAAVWRWLRRHPYVLEHIIVFLQAVGALLIGLAEVLYPNDLLNQTSIGRELGTVPQYAWAVLMVAGALLCIYGLIRRQLGVEILGLIMLAGVFAIDSYIVFHVFGFARASVVGSVLAWLTLSFGARAGVLSWERWQVVRELKAVTDYVNERQQERD